MGCIPCSGTSLDTKKKIKKKSSEKIQMQEQEDMDPRYSLLTSFPRSRSFLFIALI